MIYAVATLLAVCHSALPRTLGDAGSYGSGGDYRMCSGVKSTALLV